MRVSALVVALLLCGACGKSLKPGRTPKETVRRFEEAIKRLDLGAVYDLLSSRARGEIDAAFSGFRGLCDSIPESQLKAAGLAGFKDMTARDLLVEAVDRAKDANPAALDSLQSLHMVVMKVREYGDRASVDVTALLNGQDQRQTIPLVRENGRWFIDSDDSLTSMPLQLTPDVAACVGPT